MASRLIWWVWLRMRQRRSRRTCTRMDPTGGLCFLVWHDMTWQPAESMSVCGRFYAASRNYALWTPTYTLDLYINYRVSVSFDVSHWCLLMVSCSLLAWTNMCRCWVNSIYWLHWWFCWTYVTMHSSAVLYGSINTFRKTTLISVA